ncbi:MAG TPA: hypothetical protein VMY18_02065, partial [Acidobacteriota bacterium]|nr:hypothetical protein [Acidobacteriota bacterium]
MSRTCFRAFGLLFSIIFLALTCSGLAQNGLFADQPINMLAGQPVLSQSDESCQPGDFLCGCSDVNDPTTCFKLELQNLNADNYFQRQDEITCDYSRRNPKNIICGVNDYRTVYFPQVDPALTRDSTVGLIESFDGGWTFQSTVFPGFAGDLNNPDPFSPALPFESRADPAVRCGDYGNCYYAFLAFNHTNDTHSMMAVGHLVDFNNYQGAAFEIGSPRAPIKYIGTTAIVDSPENSFVDKEWLAVANATESSQMSNISLTVPDPNDPDCVDPDSPSCGTMQLEHNVPCGNVYVGWANFKGEQSKATKIELGVSRDCAATFSVQQLGDSPETAQGVSIALDPNDQLPYVAWTEFNESGGGDRFILTRAKDPDGKSFSQAAVIGEFPPPSPADLNDEGIDPTAREPFHLFTMPSTDIWDLDPFRQPRS